MIMLYKYACEKHVNKKCATQNASIKDAFATPGQITLYVNCFILKCFFASQLHDQIGISSLQIKMHFIIRLTDKAY